MGFQANPILPWNCYILCYISLFTEIILQQLDAFKIEIQGTLIRVPTSSGNHGKPGKSQIKIPCMEKSWNLIKAEKSGKNQGIFVKSVLKLTARGN